MSPEGPILSILADWPNWRDSGVLIDTKPQLLNRFNDGLNHDVVLIEVTNKGVNGNCVLKCFSRANPNAIKTQQWAHQLGIAPEIYYVDPDFTYCVMDHLKTDTILPSSTPAENLNAIAKGLSRFHSAPIPEHATSSNVFDLLAFCEHYLRTAGERAQKIHKQVLMPLNEFISDATPLSFCHNDLVVGNCFVMNRQAQFIDWEYAQVHNPWFDLAAIIYYLQLDDKQAGKFIDSYEHGWSVFVGTSIFYTSQLALLWTDMLWHLAKFGPEFWPRLEVKFNDLKQLLQINETLL